MSFFENIPQVTTVKGGEIRVEKVAVDLRFKCFHYHDSTKKV